MHIKTTEEAIQYLKQMKAKYPNHDVMSELTIDNDDISYRDCCTEVVNRLNDEQIINIAHSITLLENSDFFTLDIQ